MIYSWYKCNIVQTWNVAMRLQKIHIWVEDNTEVIFTRYVCHLCSAPFSVQYWVSRSTQAPGCFLKSHSYWMNDFGQCFHQLCWLHSHWYRFLIQEKLTLRSPSSALHSRWAPRKRQSQAATCGSLWCCLLHIISDSTTYQRGDRGASWRPDAAPGL